MRMILTLFFIISSLLSLSHASVVDFCVPATPQTSSRSR
ncbi:hypothetical protein GLYMA_09G068866v4 [Glycine max]|nr:hypothetical protein GLYMA_09G068866v4 [Glycine max]KAH1041883.1 hypothetical protein GYH30_024284 [Glycine max]